MGNVLGELEDQQDILTLDLDFSIVEETRKNMPCLNHVRLYD